MTRVLLLGFAVQDLVFALDRIPTEAVKYRAKALEVVGGGLAATASVAVAKLGGRAALITRLGDDMVGREIVAELERNGVDMASTVRLPGKRSPVSAVIVDAAGERMIVNYAEPDLPDGLHALPDVLPPDVRAVMADVRWTEGATRLFALARAAGVPSVLDLDRKVPDPDFHRGATHVAMSHTAMREMTGETEPAKGLALLARQAHNWLAVTHGGEGVWYTGPHGLFHEPAYPVTPVDTLGAGDTWHGAFTLALAEGKGEREAVRFASAAAALKCTRFGGRAGIPSRAEVEAFMAANPRE